MVDMADGTFYAMRPVIHGLCKYESLLDGTLTLGDLARMNDALDVDFENKARISAWLEKRHGQ